MRPVRRTDKLTTFMCRLSWNLGASVSWNPQGLSNWLRTGRSGDRIPGVRDFPPLQTGPGAHPTSCTMGTVSFPGIKYGRGVLLTTHPLLVLRSWKSRATPLPTLWATPRPVTGSLYLFTFLVVADKKNYKKVLILQYFLPSCCVAPDIFLTFFNK